ncbi:MAG: hypothetical protein SGILL_009817, partial [Bacillariaceae sp.]
PQHPVVPGSTSAANTEEARHHQKPETIQERQLELGQRKQTGASNSIIADLSGRSGRGASNSNVRNVVKLESDVPESASASESALLGRSGRGASNSNVRNVVKLESDMPESASASESALRGRETDVSHLAEAASASESAQGQHASPPTYESDESKYLEYVRNRVLELTGKADWEAEFGVEACRLVISDLKNNLLQKDHPYHQKKVQVKNPDTNEYKTFEQAYIDKHGSWDNLFRHRDLDSIKAAETSARKTLLNKRIRVLCWHHGFAHVDEEES